MALMLTCSLFMVGCGGSSKTLATPTNVAVTCSESVTTGVKTYAIGWTAVKNAGSYVVDISGVEYYAAANNLAMPSTITTGIYDVKVRAIHSDTKKYKDSVYSANVKHHQETEGFAYALTVAQDAYIVSKGKANTDGAVVLPLIHGDSLPVTTIETDGFKNCTTITSITIPEGYTSIKEGAFGGCTSLEFVVIPSTITSFEELAFAGCDESLLTLYIAINSENRGMGWSAVFDYISGPDPMVWATKFWAGEWEYVDGVPTVTIYTPHESGE